MKKWLLPLALACAFFTPPAAAQWQVQTTCVPVGRGAGVTGFNSGCATTGILQTLAGGSAATSTLTLRDTTNGVATTSSIRFLSAAGATSIPTMNAGALGNNPWEFKSATANIATTGKWFWTTGTPNAVVDGTYNCATPLTIAGQPLDADTSFNFCGTYTNSTGVQKYSNMVTATVYVDGPLLDINAIVGTAVARQNGTGGAGIVGLGKAETTSAIAHGAEISATCHANAANCTGATALLLPIGGGNGGLAVQQYVSIRSGAAANSAIYGINLGDGPTINPFQNTGSSVMRAAGAHVRFDYGIDFSAATVNTCAFASPGQFCVTGAGDINTGGAASGHTGKINLLGATSGTITIQPQAAAGSYNFNLPTSAGNSGDVLTSGGGGASAMTFGKVANSSLANMANATIKGRITAGTGSPEDLTIQQVASLMGAPTITRYTTGSGTHTVAANTKYLSVVMTGGGGGGGGAGTTNTAAGAGGNTCWNTSGAACTTPVLQAGGGAAGGSNTGATTAGGTVTGSTSCARGFSGGTGMAGGNSAAFGYGGAGGDSWYGGGGAPVTSGNGNPGSAGLTNSGGGGSGGTATFATGTWGNGGGGGAYCEHVFTSPAASYTYAIGAAGTAGVQTGGAGAQNGGAGGSGEIIVYEYQQ